MLNLPCIHLDRFYWQPGWREASSEDFRSRVFAALDEDPRGWIVDGNYTRVLGTKISGEATDVICERHRPFSLPSRLSFGPGRALTRLPPHSARARSTADPLLPASGVQNVSAALPAQPTLQYGLRGESKRGLLLARQHHLVVCCGACLLLSAAPRVPVVRSSP